MLHKLNTPQKVKDFVFQIEYNPGKRFSIKEVYEKRKGDCLEVALLACHALNMNGYDAFLIDLEAVRDEDHVLCVYKEKGKFGAIGQSKFVNLRNREPVYSSVRELVMSYFPHYFNFFGELTLRRFSVPLNILKLVQKYGTNNIELNEEAERLLCAVKHERILPDKKRLPRVSKEKFWSEIGYLPAKTRIGKHYEKTKRRTKKNTV